MTDLNKEPQLTRTGTWSLIGLFCILLVAPAVLGLMGLFTTPGDILKLQEKRPPAKLPAWPRRISSIKQMPKGVELWFNDHFGLRRALIRANALGRYYLGASSNPSMVIIGKDNWLYLGNRWANTVNQYRGFDRFTPKTLSKFMRVVKARNNWLKARGIPMVYVIAVDKSETYPQYLPSWACNTGLPTRRKQILKAMKNSGIHFVDTTEAVRAAREKAITFFKTDSHWNDYGAFVAYGAVMDYISEHITAKGFRHLGREEYQLQTKSIDGLDFPLMLGMNNSDVRDIDVSVRFAKPMPALEVRDIAGNILSTDENPKVNGLAIRDIRCPSVGGDGLKVLLLHDSFTRNMSPYFNCSFAQSVYCGEKRIAGQEMTTLVERCQPDLVLWIMVQRRLGHPPRKHPNWMKFSDGRTPRERFGRGVTVAAGSSLEFQTRVIKSDMSGRLNRTPEGLMVGPGESRFVMEIKPLLSKGGGGNHVLRLEITSPETTKSVLWFRAGGKNVKWRHRTAPLFTGRNVVYFDLPFKAAGYSIRLALDGAQGCFFIGNWEIRRLRAGGK